MSLPIPESITRRWPPRLILACGIALALLCDGFVANVLYSNYLETNRAAARADSDLVRVLDEYTQRTLQAIDLSIRITSNQIAADPEIMTPGNPRLIAALRRTISMYDAVQALVVLDANGALVADSLGNGVPGRRFDFSDRSYFRAHRDHTIEGQFVDVPRRARANSGKFFIAISRALRGPNGAFQGVIFAALDYEQIAQFFRSLDVGHNGVVSLFRTDGALMVRVPGREELVGHDYSNAALFAQHLARSPMGSFRGSNASFKDTGARRVTYRKVTGLPFVVTVSRAEVEILAGWRDGVWTYGLAAAALNCMIIALGVLLAREWRRRETTQEALAESLIQQRLVTDNLPAAIIAVGADRRVRFANPAIAEWYQRSVSDLIGADINNFVPPKVLETFEPGIRTALAGKVQRSEDKVRYPDGRDRWIDFTRVPDFGADGRVRGYVTLAIDVTARHEAEDRLRESEEHFRKVFEMSPDAIYVHVDGRIVIANRAAALMFGYDSSEAMVGVEVYSLYHPESHEMIRARRAALLERGLEAPAIEHRYLRRDGEVFLGEARASNFDWQGEQGTILFVRDTTERKHFEQELIAARDRAEVANRVKSEFLANMSHELRTPLNAIIGFSEILKDERLSGARPPREYASDIHESGLHLLNIINDVLDMAKIEAGKIVLAEELIDVRSEIEAAMRMVAPRAHDGGLQLLTEIERDLPLIFVDRRIFKQIMLNILSNAVKFTSTGGRVVASARRDPGGSLTVAVTDTGIGIHPKDLERVLQPFGQAESGLARRYEGTGLGLPICKALIELHGGTIAIASTPGAGTTVTVRFPADRVRQHAA